MPRQARVTVVGVPHLVSQRSLNGRTLFPAEKDRAAYMDTLREQAKLYRVDVLAYCLLRDRAYLVLIPHTRDGLSRAVGRTHFWYAQYLNRRRGRAGKLWHDRFHSCAVDKKHLPEVVQYVECQPVYDKLARQAEKYQWSSAGAHVGGKDEFGVLSLNVWPSPRLRKQWRQLLRRKLDAAAQERVRLHMDTGRPLGTKAFVADLEKKFRRRLHALPVGRPPKEA